MKKRKWMAMLLTAAMVIQLVSVPVLAQENGTDVPIYSVENESKSAGMKEVKIDQSLLKAEANSVHLGKEENQSVDGDTTTFWDAAWQEGDKGLGVLPIIMTIQLDKVRTISKLTYLPRQDNNTNGRFKDIKITAVMQDNSEVVIKDSVKWSIDVSLKTVSFDPVSAKAIKIEILDASTTKGMATAAEINLYEQVAVLEMNKQALALKVGEQEKLEITTQDVGTASFVSNNPEIAMVDAQGNVIGMKEGTTVLYAYAENGGRASCDVSVSQSTEPKKAGYNLVFEDDFDGTTLDNTKWNNWCVDLNEAEYFRYGNTPDSVVAPENVKVGDGMLHLLGTKDPVTFDGQVSNYKMGTVQTRDIFQPTYGYMEAMVRFPDVAGSNPAVWTMPRRTEDNTDWQWNSPEGIGAEIDILERPHPLGHSQYAGLENKYWTTIHFDNYNGALKFHQQPTINNPYEWHKFGMDWTKDYVKFMMDDKVVATYTGENVPTAPEIFILSYGLGGWLGTIDPAMTESEMVVDYVRWYQEDPVKLQLEEKAMTVNVEETKKLDYDFVKDGKPFEIEDNIVSIVSDDPSIAKVDADGNVVGVSEGITNVTITTQALRSAVCEVSVSEVNKVKQGYRLVFEDNFSGETLDSSKWNNWCVDLKESGPFRYGNSPEVALVPENAYVKNGSLRLLGSKEDTTFDGKTSTYRMGAVQTRDIFEPKFGYVEAMVKIPDVPGSNPAVWTMPKVSSSGSGFQWDAEDGSGFGAEIDILERPHPLGDSQYAGLANKYWITMHYDNYEFTNHKKYHVQPTINNPYEWHKFGMEWTPEYINFMLDGKVVATQNNDVPNIEEIFILSYGLGGWIGKIADEYLPAEMLVDYVRWYQLDDTKVSLSPSELTLKGGETKKLAVNITPANAKDEVKMFISAKPEIVSVDEKGNVTGNANGTTTITLITKEGRTAEAKVTVVDAGDFTGGGSAGSKPEGDKEVEKLPNGNTLEKTETTTDSAGIKTVEKIEVEKNAKGEIVSKTTETMLVSKEKDMQVTSVYKEDAKGNQSGAYVTANINLPKIAVHAGTAEVECHLDDTLVKQAMKDIKADCALEIILVPDSVSNSLSTSAVKKANVNVVIPQKMLTENKLTLTSLNLDGKLLQKAKDNKKRLTISVKNENKDNLYAWVFDQGFFKNTNITFKDVNLAVSVGTTKEMQPSITKDGICISGKGIETYQGQLKINLNEIEGFQKEDKQYLYYLNTKTQKVKVVSKKNYQVSKNGYLILDSKKSANYIFSNSPIK